jgi:CRP-like cAMP-binding protein
MGTDFRNTPGIDLCPFQNRREAPAAIRERQAPQSPTQNTNNKIPYVRMTIDSRDPQIIRSLIPLATLPASRFEELLAACRVEEAPRGTTLFHQGDRSNDYVYLLGGKIVLRAGEVEMDTIDAGSETARFALAHQIPRKVSAIAKNKVRFIRVHPRFLHFPDETSKPPASYHVGDIPQESPHDWMTALLRLPLFQQIPAAHLQKVLIELEEVRVKSGRRILEQGKPADYYYIIKKGRCALSRKPAEHAREIVLARLKACNAFGEEALISAEPSQVSATMSTDGILLRLDRERFLQSIKEPLIRSIDFETARQEASEQSTLLDVRPPEAFEKKHLRGSVNIPFFSLPMQLNELEKNRQHTVVCDSGKISETAVFILIKNGFHAVVLKDGLNKIPDEYFVIAPRNETIKSRAAPSQSSGSHTKAAPPGKQLEIARGRRSSRGQHPEKEAGRAIDGSAAELEEAHETDPRELPNPAVVPAATVDSSEQPAALKKRIKALEEERIALRTQIQQYRLEAAESLGSLQEQLDAAVAERQSLNDRLTEKTEIIAELESTIHALRARNADLEQQQQIKIFKAQPAAEEQESTEPGPLQLPSRAMSHG